MKIRKLKQGLSVLHLRANTHIFMALIIQKIKTIISLAIKHKAVALFVIVALAGGGYYGYTKIFNNAGTVRYISAQVGRGNLVVSVSGSGQVSATNQVDIKAKASGDIVYLANKNNDIVAAGGIIAKIDSRDAQKAVRDAEISLERAKITLEKMKGLETSSGILRGIKEKATDDLQKAYDDGFNNVSNAFLNLPTVMSGLNDILFGTSIAGATQNQWNMDYYADATVKYDDKALVYRDMAYASYQKARLAYDKNFISYKNTTRDSGGAEIEAMILKTYDTTKDVSAAIKDGINLIQFYKDKLTERGIKANSSADTHLTQLNGYTNITNSSLLSLLSIKNSIETNKETFASADFDISDQEINVKQAENALTEVKEKLADYTIRAPFAGTLAKINIKINDTISANTVAAILITGQRIAETSLNEVDVAKVKVGQKVTITFDAIEGLSITGEVAEIDSIGTIAQGVVTYGIKINFDTQDERVKPGMSVSAAIITDVRQDVLLVPNSAVKQKNGVSFVEIYTSENQVPQQQEVTIGLSNDTMTEIVNGLNEGEKVVTQTIAVSAVSSSAQPSTGLRIPGISTGGGGARIGGGLGH